MPEEERGRGTRLSVIIPVLNEEAMVARVLASLEASECPPGCFEVVIVDNGSTDRTIEVARTFGARLRLTILVRPGVNISALRNLGAAEASGEMLAFLDADCLVPRHWIASVCRLLEKPAAGIIGCSYSIPAGSGWVARAWYGAGNAPKDGPVTYVPSGDLLVRREDFLRIGGFNESLKTSEDCELCFRAHRAGLPVRSATELAVVHLRTPQTVAGFYKTQRWHGTHVAKVFAANLRERANARAVLLAVCMLLCACAAAAGLAVALLLRSYLLLVGGLGSMIAVSFLCALHRLRHLKGGAFWRVLLPLAFLQAVWGLARAHSLLAVHSSYPRLAGDKAKTKKESASQLDQCR